MTNKEITLKAEKRTEAGHKTGENLRIKGLMPAVTYGKGLDTESITIKVLDFEKVYEEAGENTIVSLDVDGEKTNVIIHDAQFDPVTSKPIHADFFKIRMDEKITADVPLVYGGTSAAVKDDGGTLVKNYDALEVTALPADMPHEIQVDISFLKTFDDSITIANLTLPENIEIEEELTSVIAVVTPPRSEEELAALDEEVTADVEDIEDVEEKKAEEGEEGEEGEGEAEGAEEKPAEADAGEGKPADKEEKKE
ncbi:50S ribosomal protein L25 [Patescibacteria group bacterium]